MNTFSSLNSFLGKTYLAKAFHYANLTIFNETNGMRADVKKLVIALTDGKESDHMELFKDDPTPSLNDSANALKLRGLQDL